MGTVFLYGLLPLVVLVIVDMFASLKWAVLAAIACAVLDVVLSYYTLNAWDPGSLLALFLLCALGYVSVREGSMRYAKMQPVLLGIAFALYVAYYQFFGQPILDRYLPLVIKAVPPEFQHNFSDPEFLRRMSKAVTGLIFVFLAHAALCWWAAEKLSNGAWLVIRGVGFWVLLVAVTIPLMAM